MFGIFDIAAIRHSSTPSSARRATRFERYGIRRCRDRGKKGLAMKPLSRRSVLSVAAVGGAVAVTSSASAAVFGNPDEPPQGAINAPGRSTSVPGPNNPALSDQFPGAFSPPPTDVGNLPMFWATFNNAPRRIQNGGWAREVTQSDFQISEEIAGVNMRLTTGGIREMHWHQFAEWANVTAGNCRITAIDAEWRRQCRGRAQRRPLVFSGGPASFVAGRGRRRLRIRHLLRRRQGLRVQHAVAN